MSTYAIGDIQGCLAPFKRLLDRIDFDPEHDRLWIAGDLVNRGPDSLDTLRYLHGMRDCVTAVLGNHDLHLLAVAFGDKTPGNKDTLDALLRAPDRDQLLHWLRHLKLLHRDTELGYTMVHAGIPPVWTIEQAEAHAREVEAVLQSDYMEAFMRQMYGNHPNRWKNKLIGYDRLRLITNYLTRMRFCSAEGELDLDNKTADAGRDGFAPWYAHKNHPCQDERIVFGHWAALEGQASANNVTALDTGCVWGGCLTALRLEDGKSFSVDCDG